MTKMLSIHNLLTTAVLLAALSSTLSVDEALRREQKKEAKADADTFQKLLNQVDPPSLHAALHDFSPKKFKHGMFPEDRTAIEVIHREEPSLATGILNMAHLAKRQSPDISNGTLLSANPSPTTTGRPTPVPQGPSTTSAAAEQSSTTTPSTPAPTSAVPTSSPIASSPSASETAGQVLTTTDASGHVIVTTIGGGAVTVNPSTTPSSSAGQSTVQASSKTSTVVRTSTLPDGSQSTMTSITVVAANTPAETPTGAAGATTTGAKSSPGLQTAEAPARAFGMEMALVFGAAAAVALL